MSEHQLADLAGNAFLAKLVQMFQQASSIITNPNNKADSSNLTLSSSEVFRELRYGSHFGTAYKLAVQYRE